MILHQAFAPLLARALHILLAVIAFQFSFEMLSPAEHTAIRRLPRIGVKACKTASHPEHSATGYTRRDLSGVGGALALLRPHL